MPPAGRRTALITGASSGIGRALAEAYARRGYALVLSARHEQPLREVADTLNRDYGVDVVAIPADLSDPAEPERPLTFYQVRGFCSDGTEGTDHPL